MKQLLKFGLVCTIATSGLMFTGCDGEDGDPGAAGPQGEKGDKGDAGENGAGFDEATKYGNIEVRYKGTRNDGVAFDKTVDYKFSPTGPDLARTSSVWEYNNGEGGTGLEFDVQRFNSALVTNYSEGGGVGYINFEFNRPDDAENESWIYLYAQEAIVSADMTFFTLYLSEYGFNFDEATDNYAFTSATGELKFNFHVTLDSENNPTGNDLDITATVNVKVLQSLDGRE